VGKLNITNLKFNGAFVVSPNKHEDDRGSFSRVYCKSEMAFMADENFVQVNHSVTKVKGTVRGLHYQAPPNSEVKMVKCIKGAVLDIIVDIRTNSPTFLQWHGEVLSAENMKMMYIPKGFAHGFQTLESNTELLYFHSNEYTPNNEAALNIADPLLEINWPLDIIGLSKRDKEHPMLTNEFKGIEIEL
jgi:dTDP-4-dehydrorhamnose 3,5-epimerase